MEMLVLKNGSSEPKVSVVSTMMSVKGLWEQGISGMCHVVELVERCHDPRACIDPSSEEALKGLALLQPDGRPHDTVKNVVLSAASGKGFEMTLESPVKPS
jgi:hypothetical protein